MKMVLHILGKDIRGLRWEIVATVALTLATALLEWPSQHATLNHLGQFWSQPAIVLAWILLVLRVVQRDGLVGAEHDWLTRPIRRWHVAAAKALFVVLFVLAPIAVRDAIVVAANGFPVLGNLPGMVWSLAVWIGVFLLPAAALAVVTRTIPQALMGVLGFVFLASVVSNEESLWQGVDWVPMGLAALVIGLFAGVVVWLQYRQRWTARARILLAVGAAAAAGVTMGLPWGAAFASQRLFATQAVDESELVIQMGELQLGSTAGWSVSSPTARLRFPVEVKGAPAGYRIRVLRVEAPAGPEGNVSLDERVPWFRQPEGGALSFVRVEMQKAQFLAGQESPARLKGRIFLAVLAPRAKQDFTFENTRQMVPGVGVCEASFDRIPVFYCRTPFRTPTETRVTLWAREPREGRVTTVLSSRSSLSPLPFEFSLAPMRGVGASIERLDYSGELSAARGLAGGRITYETWAPVAFIEREFDVTGRKLGDYRVP